MFRVFLPLIIGGPGCARSNLPPAAPPAPPVTPVAGIEAAASLAPTLAAEAEIAVVGDIIMHGSVKRAATRSTVLGPDGASTNFDGYGALFDAVRPVLSEADLAFANMEFPVAPDSHRSEGSMVFNAPPVVLDALADAGFDVVSFANNHVFDQGTKGFIETMARLDASPLDYLGAGPDCDTAMNGKIYEIDGIKIAFLAGTRLYNTYKEPAPGRCSFRVHAGKEVIRRAQAAREAGADVVLLSLHWGGEYKTQPYGFDVKIAHDILEGGVDGIIGHHPHVLQPLEVYETKDGRTTFVIYSLGNFLSGQGYGYRHGLQPLDRGNTRDGGILRFKVVQRDYGDGHIETGIADLRLDPIWVIRQRDNPQTHPVVPRIEIARLTAEIEATEDPDARHALQRELGFYLDRREHVGSIVGEQWLQLLDPPPSALPAAEE